MKAKSIILALFAFTAVCGHTLAQDNLPYRPFKSFNNDTVQYLDYNFFIRDDQYAGKKISDVINDLKLPILSVSFPMELSTSGATSTITGIDLAINRFKQWSSFNYTISITLATPFTLYDPDFRLRLKFINDNDGNTIIHWTTELYEFLKDKEIKSVTANSNLIEERRKLINMHTPEADAQLKNVIATEKANWRKRIQAEKQTVDK